MKQFDDTHTQENTKKKGSLHRWDSNPRHSVVPSYVSGQLSRLGSKKHNTRQKQTPHSVL